MNRRILLVATAPAVIIGLVLVGVCVVSAWHVNRLQTNLASILSRNVSSLHAAQQMEIALQQMSFRCYVCLLNPDPGLFADVREFEERFEGWIGRARELADSDEERQHIAAIEAGFRRYREEFAEQRGDLAAGVRLEPTTLANANPAQHVVGPCQDLFDVNERVIVETQSESERVSGWLQVGLLFLAVGGPVSGVVMGYGMARGVSRSIERAQQLSALGQLAAGVAHEVRNPLTSIKMLVEGALRPTNPRPLTPDTLRVIVGEVVRLEKTVAAFLDFARPQPPSRLSCDLADLAGQTLDLVRARARQQRVEVELVGPRRPVRALADAAQLRTVLVNLVINALDAMPQGGRLTLGLEGDATGARFRVEDTGPGVPAKVAARLFTPFVSGKPTGTGLGLSISRRIVEEHGGRLTWANRHAAGAAFIVTLPPSRE